MSGGLTKKVIKRFKDNEFSLTPGMGKALKKASKKASANKKRQTKQKKKK